MDEFGNPIDYHSYDDDSNVHVDEYGNPIPYEGVDEGENGDDEGMIYPSSSWIQQTKMYPVDAGVAASIVVYDQCQELLWTGK